MLHANNVLIHRCPVWPCNAPKTHCRNKTMTHRAAITAVASATVEAAATTTNSTTGASASATTGVVSVYTESGGNGGGSENTRVCVVSPSQDIEGVEFSPLHLCPFLLGEPPLDGAYFCKDEWKTEDLILWLRIKMKA